MWWGVGSANPIPERAAELWWRNEAQGPYQGQNGAFCYVDSARHRKGQWLGGEDPFFEGPCDSGAR